VPQTTHVDPQIVTALDVAGPPHFLQELTVREHFAGVFHQSRKEAILDRRQVHLVSVPVDAAVRQVHLEARDREHSAFLLRGRARVPQRDADAREQFAQPERLGEVVVGACVERRDLVGSVRAESTIRA
jgi:hypothetical protein